MPGTNQPNDATDGLIVMPVIQHTAAIIKAVGVGGGGGNAVAQMYREGIDGVSFLVANTDSKALGDNPVPDKLQLGPGLGAGGKPEVGSRLAGECRERIARALDDGTKMVFITAGEGGGTGTGASPVIAAEARKLGILTVGIVTIPFLFEGRRQIDKALDGLDALAKQVDAMLVVNNERLIEIYPDCSVIDAFRHADNTLTTAVRCIVEIIAMHGRIGLDFNDVCNVLRNGGVAIMSTGYGKGENRVGKAIEQALYSPLLNNNDVYRSRKIILSITTSDDNGQALRMDEMNEIHNFMGHFRSDVETKWGLTFDHHIGDSVKVTILASGFRLYEKDEATVAVVDDERSREREERRLRNYPSLQTNHRPHPKVFIFNTADLANEGIIAEVEGKPTAQRSLQELHNIVGMKRGTADGRARAATDTLQAAGEPPVIDFTVDDCGTPSPQA